MIAAVATLLRTFVSIILLKRGPDAVPHSQWLFGLLVISWLALGAGSVLGGVSDAAGFALDGLLATVALGIYAVVIRVFEKPARTLQSLTAILGCGLVFSVVLLLCNALLPRLMPERTAEWLQAGIWFWSIPVEGHIIARTIERHWYLGFLIACAVLLVQLQLLFALRPAVPGAG